MRPLLFLIMSSLILTACSREPEYDIILRNGTIYDGTGTAPVRGDVAIQADRIAAVGDVGSARAREEIDVAGLAVAPGFINMLSWATEPAPGRRPLAERHPAGRHAGSLWRRLVDGSAQREDERNRGQSSRATSSTTIKWTTLGEYLELPGTEAACRPTSLRSSAPRRCASTSSVTKIARRRRRNWSECRRLVRQAMEEGALGVGSSLIYAPAFYAGHRELIELCKVAAEHGGHLHLAHAQRRQSAARSRR